MKAVLINGSPKAKGSASEMFAKELETRLAGKGKTTLLQWNRTQAAPGDFATIADCDALVLTFPLYVDGIPSHLLRILRELERALRQCEHGEIKVYAIVNAGFYEGDQNRLALEMLRHWTARAGLTWGMGLGIGGGPMLAGMPKVPMGNGPKTSLGQAYNELAAAVLCGQGGENRFVGPDFPRRFYILAAHMGWRAEGRQNKLRRRELYRKIAL